MSTYTKFNLPRAKTKKDKPKESKMIKPPKPSKPVKPAPKRRTISSRTGALGATSGY